MLYYSLFVVMAIGGLGELFAVYHKNGKTVRILYYSVSIIIFVLSALRWERGTDWNSFYSYFLNPWTYWDQHFEFGYAILTKLVRRITGSYSVFLAIQTGIYLILSKCVFDRTNEMFKDERTIYFPLLLYQFASEFAGLFSTRSMIAGLLCVLALFQIKERRLLRFSLLIVLAASFHTASLAFFAAYPIYHMKGKPINVYLRILGLTVAAMVFYEYIPLLMSRIPLLSRYTTYIRVKASGDISVIGWVKWLVLLVTFMYISIRTKNADMERIVRVFAIGVAVYTWSVFYGSVFNRLSALYLGAAFPLIGYTIHTFEGKNKATVYIIYVIICFAIFYATFNGNYHPLYEPYKSVFDDFAVITQVGY